jgi:hypothetical protein
MGADGFFQKNSVPHSLMTTNRMSLISAGSISLDTKTTDLVQLLTKAQWTFISAIPIGFQIANKKQGDALKPKGDVTGWVASETHWKSPLLSL